MGQASRANPMAEENIGRYNVIITLTNLDGEDEAPIGVQSWHQRDDYLALSINPGMLRIVVLKNYKYYTITPQARVVT